MKGMPSNFDEGVDVLFTAHYGSRHDMMIMDRRALVRNARHAVICDNCFDEITPLLITN